MRQQSQQLMVRANLQFVHQALWRCVRARSINNIASNIYWCSTESGKSHNTCRIWLFGARTQTNKQKTLNAPSSTLLQCSYIILQPVNAADYIFIAYEWVFVFIRTSSREYRPAKVVLGGGQTRIQADNTLSNASVRVVEPCLPIGRYCVARRTQAHIRKSLACSAVAPLAMLAREPLYISNSRITLRSNKSIIWNVRARATGKCY